MLYFTFNCFISLLIAHGLTFSIKKNIYAAQLPKFTLYICLYNVSLSINCWALQASRPLSPVTSFPPEAVYLQSSWNWVRFTTRGTAVYSKCQASHRFFDSYESLIAHVQQRRKLTIVGEETERRRKGREEHWRLRQGQYNERRDSRSAHDDGLEETLPCSSFFIMIMHLQEVSVIL